MNRTLSGTTTLGLNRPGSDDNKLVLYISQSSSITEALPSDCLLPFTGSYITAEKPSVFSATSTEWASYFMKNHAHTYIKYK